MKKAFLFPGQGAQYPGMGKDFYESYPIAKSTFEEANDLLGRDLAKVVLEGPVELLTETKNSQTGIYVVSIAILRVINDLFPDLSPSVCAGLSLGEYTAATAAGYLTFDEGLPLVQRRGQYMNDACVATKGAMAVILGLSAEEVERLVHEIDLPKDLWAANFNCPGQVVVSGTERGIAALSAIAKEKGAKRVLPLQVHGAFHSGLMKSAQDRLSEYVNQVKLGKPFSELVMNVSGDFVSKESEIKRLLIEQVTSPVRWEQSIRAIDSQGIALYLEIGPGNTLAGFNKRIGVKAPTLSIEKVEDLRKLEEALVCSNY
jgi:[acyl-carrier-protein] S-malonyltransferase